MGGGGGAFGICVVVPVYGINWPGLFGSGTSHRYTMFVGGRTVLIPKCSQPAVGYRAPRPIVQQLSPAPTIPAGVGVLNVNCCAAGSQGLVQRMYTPPGKFVAVPWQ